MNHIAADRYNFLIQSVNDKKSKDELSFQSKDEEICFDSLWEEASSHLEQYGFWPTFEYYEMPLD